MMHIYVAALATIQLTSRLAEHECSIFQEAKNQQKAHYQTIALAPHTAETGLEQKMNYFLMNYPKSSYANITRYWLGHLLYQKGNFLASHDQYAQVKMYELPRYAQSQLRYEQAHNYIRLKNWPKAKEAFEQVSQHEDKYYHAAQLELFHLALRGQRHEQAFTLIDGIRKKDPSKAKYLTLELYHKIGDFDRLITQVQDDPILLEHKETQLLMGDAFFFRHQYESASHHYQVYLNGRKMQQGSDLYVQAKLGHALYSTEKFNEALAHFTPLLSTNHEIGQIAHYYTADIHQQQGNMERAKKGFLKAQSQSWNPSIQALALIKLATIYAQENQLKEAIELMETFTTHHPNSSHLVSAQILLAAGYYKCKMYAKTIHYIDQLPYKNEYILSLYQKALFYQGLLAYNEGDDKQAIHHLKQSTLFVFDQPLLTQARFWLAEAYTVSGAYEQAIEQYQAFMRAGTTTLYHANALYGLGYAQFNQGLYEHALHTFEQYTSMTHQKQGSTYYDATLRLADCQYAQKNYKKALEMYSSGYSYAPAYVRYQQALIYQAMGEIENAETSIQEILVEQVQTPYYKKALYFEASLLFDRGHYDRAIEHFGLVLDNDPATDLLPDIFMKRALAYENIKKYHQATDDYMAIVEKHPHHVQAQGALMALSHLADHQGMGKELGPFLEKHQHAFLGTTKSQDQQSINEAEQWFYNQNYDQVLRKLLHFQKQFPKSSLLGQAYFLIAESYYRSGNHAPAINYYKKITVMQKKTYQTKAWLRIGMLSYQLKRFKEAITSYQQLKKMELTTKERSLVLIGLVKASFALGQYKITTPTCLQIINQTQKYPTETWQEAHLYLGKIAMRRSMYASAKQHFLKATKPIETAIASEAQYELAYAAYKLKKYTFALQTLFVLIDKFPQNSKHIDRAFLLMADIYVKMGNMEQAKATLESIIRKSKHGNTVKQAQKKKDLLNFS